MKKWFRKITAVMLVIVMIAFMVLAGIVSACAITQSEFDNRLNDLRNQYPNYSTWYGSFDGGTQCFGFARLVAYNVFGSHVRDWGVSYSMDGVKAGDVIQYGSTNGSGHTIFVTSVSGDTIYYVDCNGLGNYSGSTKVRDCGIKWDNNINKWATMYGTGFSYRHVSPNIEKDNPPTNAWITVSSTSIPVGNSIYFNYGADGATYPFTIGIDRNGSRYITEDNWAGKSFTFNEAGDYSAFITAWNDSGYCNSERVYFKVIPQGHVMTDAEGAGQTIPDGDYWICSRISQTYYLDIEGDNFNTKNGDNLTTHIWESQNPYNLLLPGKWDAFHLKYLNNGFYQITQYNTQMAIDVDGVSVNCGTNVQMWEVNNSYAQQWSIEKTDKGYKLRARCSAFYMDIDGDVLCNGTNVQTWDGWDGNCQLFSFIPYAPDERPIADGIYTINSSLGNTCYLDVAGVPGEFTKKSNVQIWNGSNPDEKFRFEYVGNGYYRIYEATSNYSVEIINEESYLDKNKNAILYEKNNSRGQFWKIKKNADGTVSLINALSGYYLDVFDGKTDNGTNVHSHPYNDSNAQKWNLRRVLNPEMVTVKSWNWVNGVMKLSVEVTVDNNKLIEGTDYTITSYINNDNFLGKISGIGNYCNSVSVEYNNEPIVGDLNGDNSVDVLDATIVQKHASGKADLTDEQRAIADINNDGVVDILDAAEIQKFAAGKITEFKKKA